MVYGVEIRFSSGARFQSFGEERTEKDWRAVQFSIWGLKVGSSGEITLREIIFVDDGNILGNVYDYKLP